MGKTKGKGKQRSNYRALEAQPETPFDKKKSRINSLQTAEDAFGGDEDDFHKQRDQVLFEDNGRAGSEDPDEISDQDEIYGLNLPDRDESESEEEEGDYDEDDEEEEDSDSAPYSSTSKPEEPRGRFAKQELADSDSEDEDDMALEKAADSNSDDEEQWTAGQYHATRRAPGEADSEDEEAEQMEVDEARRLQKKLRGVLEGDDFGLVEGEEEGEVEVKRGRIEDDEKVAEEETQEMSEEQAIAYLLREKPEVLALVEDFGMAAERMKGVEKNLEEVRAMERSDKKEHPARAIMELEHQALSTYLPSLSFFFSLLLSPSPSQKLVDSVLERLAELRTALATMEELDLTSENVDEEDEDMETLWDKEMEMEDGEGDEEEEEGILASDLWDMGGVEPESESESEDEDEQEFDGNVEEDDFSEDEEGSGSDEELDSQTTSMLDGLTEAELAALMDEMDEGDLGSADKLMEKVKELQARKESGKAVNGSGSEESRGKKRKRGGAKVRAKMEKAASVLNLVPTLAPLSSKASKKGRSTSAHASSDFLDPVSLSSTDLADKASARHSLRFHVSQVNQKSAKRAAGPTRIGGDDDLPRRSKERSRREVLKRQEHGGKKGEALDGEDWGEKDLKAAKEVKGEEYYDLVKSGREEEKLKKKEKYDQERREEKAALDEASSESAAGPRGATRKILANKGLQPKRAKVNRNPRLKKRLRYDKAIKKVATMKSVYSGKEASKGMSDYQGEKSGIGKGVVKSVRLNK